MAKCRRLQGENEELGKQLSDGDAQKYQTQLVLQKQYSAELATTVQGIIHRY